MLNFIMSLLIILDGNLPLYQLRPNVLSILAAILVLIGYLLLFSSYNVRRIKSDKRMVYAIICAGFVVIFFLIMWDNPSDDDEFLRQAHQLTHAEKYDDALNLLNESIEKTSNNSLAYIYRGIVYSELEDYDAALSDFATALKLAEESEIMSSALLSEVLLYRGRTYAKMGDYELAINNFNKIIANDSSRIKAYLFRGDAYYESKDLDRALCDYEHYLYISKQNDYRIKSIVEELKGRVECRSASN